MSMKEEFEKITKEGECDSAFQDFAVFKEFIAHRAPTQKPDGELAEHNLGEWLKKKNSFETDPSHTISIDNVADSRNTIEVKFPYAWAEIRINSEDYRVHLNSGQDFLDFAQMCIDAGTQLSTAINLKKIYYKETVEKELRKRIPEVSEHELKRAAILLAAQFASQIETAFLYYYADFAPEELVK